MFKVLSLYSNTGPETSSPFVDCVIDNGLPYARPDLHQALLQFIHIFHRLLVHTLLYTAPNAVVNRVEVGAVVIIIIRHSLLELFQNVIGVRFFETQCTSTSKGFFQIRSCVVGGGAFFELRDCVFTVFHFILFFSYFLCCTYVL